MRPFLRPSASLLLSIATAITFFPASAYAQVNGDKRVDPNPHPKAALLSDDLSLSDYMTILLSPPLQAAIKVSDHQRAVFDAMGKRFDFNFKNVVGMHGSASMNIARIKYVAELTGKQVRDQLTVEQDKQVQEYFTKKILSRVTVESETSEKPVYDPHIVAIPGLGHRLVQVSILHSGSITIHYTKFSETGAAATQAQATSAPALESIDVNDLPLLDPDAEKHMDELRQSVKDRAARFHAERAQAATQATAQQAQQQPRVEDARREADRKFAESLAAARADAEARQAQAAAAQHNPSQMPSAPASTDTTKPAAPVANAPAVHMRSPVHHSVQTIPLRIPPVIPPDAQATPSTDKLADTLTASVSHAIETKSFVSTRAVGGGFADQSAFDMPGKPGVLVGFELGLGNFMNGKVIQSLVPIYLTAAGEVRGHFYGKKCDQNVSVRAKDGYAVGGVIIRGGGGLDAICVQFMKRDADSLNEDDTYYSDVIGGNINQSPQEQNANGIPIIGVSVKVGDNGALGLGVILASPPPKE